MARQLEDIFNECYERIRSGESLKSCLKRYPKYAAELEPLLKTAFDIGRRASYIQPRPEFKHWARVNLEGMRHHARQQKQPAKPHPFIWRQSWSVAVAAVLIIVLTGSSTVIASSNALPDEPLYPVKLATEDMKLSFAISDTQKAQVHTQLAETRAAEVETMADQGKTEYAAMTAARLAKQLELANFAIAKVEYNVGTTPIPTTTEDQPLPTEGQPPVTDEQPQVTEGQPPVTDEQPLTTEEQPPVTEEQPQVTEGQPPVTEEQPQVTEEQPQVTEEQPTPPSGGQPTPNAFSTRDKGVTARTERFKKSLENSTSKSLKALESAKEKAPVQAKPDWQRAIDIISEKNEDGTGDGNNQYQDNDEDRGQNNTEPASSLPDQPAQIDNTTTDEGEPVPALPSQPAPQSDNITRDGGEPAPISPNQPASQNDNTIRTGGVPNLLPTSNNQPSSSEWQNSGIEDLLNKHHK